MKRGGEGEEAAPRIFVDTPDPAGLLYYQE
jgi:hypothetical protein